MYLFCFLAGNLLRQKDSIPYPKHFEIQRGSRLCIRRVCRISRMAFVLRHALRLFRQSLIFREIRIAEQMTHHIQLYLREIALPGRRRILHPLTGISDLRQNAIS